MRKDLLSHTQHALIQSFKFRDIWIDAEHAIKICLRLLSIYEKMFCTCCACAYIFEHMLSML
jgi:hypothetical protein